MVTFTMRRIKALVRKFFGFSRTETNGFLILLPLIVIVIFSEPVYRWWDHRKPIDHSADDRRLDSLIASLEWETIDSVTKERKVNKTIEKKMFHFSTFDPNLASESEFTQMGMTSFLAKRIQHYREKGGKFYKKEDLLRVYGMDTSWYGAAVPWISIPPKENKQFASKTPFEKKKPYEPVILDINTADSLQFLGVYGIGPALSKRIRTFRDRLGGFTSLEQLKEVYGLDSTVVKELKKKFLIADDFVPQQINLNQVTSETKHPYIKWKEAQAIAAYKMQHGNFTSIEQLSEIKILTEDWIRKAKPYLKVE